MGPSCWNSRRTASVVIPWATRNATAKQDEVKKWEESDPIGIYREAILTRTSLPARKALDEIGRQGDG